MAGAVFRFRFQKVLEARERKERLLKIEIGRLDRAIAQKRALLDGWESTRRHVIDEMRRARQESDLALNAQCAHYLAYVRDQIRLCRQAEAELAASRQKVCAELERVMQSRKLLEKQRERLWKLHLEAQERADEHWAELHSMRRFANTEERA